MHRRIDSNLNNKLFFHELIDELVRLNRQGGLSEADLQDALSAASALYSSARVVKMVERQVAGPFQRMMDR